MRTILELCVSQASMIYVGAVVNVNIYYFNNNKKKHLTRMLQLLDNPEQYMQMRSLTSNGLCL